MTKRLRRQFLLGLLLVNAALTAQAQGTAPDSPRLPPAPTPTEAYPGGGMSSSFASPNGVTLYSWQSLYLPIQARLHLGELNAKTGKPAELALSAQIAVRNTDPRASLKLTSARYYNAEGRLLREFVPHPQSIPPLGTFELLVSPSNSGASPGSSFIVEWSADRPINPPLVEAIHSDGRGLIFFTTAHQIYQR